MAAIATLATHTPNDRRRKELLIRAPARPMNNIPCDVREHGRHEWATIKCARQKQWSVQRDAGILPQHFGGFIPPTRCAHCRPLAPRPVSLRSGVVVILENPKNWALTQRRLWATDEHYEQAVGEAVQNSVQQPSESACKARQEKQRTPVFAENCGGLPFLATPQVAAVGLEPTARGL